MMQISAFRITCGTLAAVVLTGCAQETYSPGYTPAQMAQPYQPVQLFQPVDPAPFMSQHRFGTTQTQTRCVPDYAGGVNCTSY